MAIEMGEYVVGAWLKEIALCDFVDYGVRVRGGGLAGLNELDVLGLHFADKTAYLCEVTTHTRGLNYKDYSETINRVTRKYDRQRDYAKRFLSNFDCHHFMFWSPVVPRGILSTALLNINGLEVVMNEDYTSRVEELQKHVMTAKQDLGNPFLRALQILSCLRKPRC
jgi:hypothetical protein